MDVLLGLGNPNLAYLVLLLEINNQFVLSLNDISLVLNSSYAVLESLLKVLNRLLLNLVEKLKFLIQSDDFVFLDNVQLFQLVNLFLGILLRPLVLFKHP